MFIIWTGARVKRYWLVEAPTMPAALRIVRRAALGYHGGKRYRRLHAVPVSTAHSALRTEAETRGERLTADSPTAMPKRRTNKRRERREARND